MGVFFTPRTSTPQVREAIRQALRREPLGIDIEVESAQLANQVRRQVRQVGTVNMWSVVVAVGLLVIFAGAALWAETVEMGTATANLWKAFEVILGVIVGFLGGEATGRADTLDAAT